MLCFEESLLETINEIIQEIFDKDVSKTIFDYLNKESIIDAKIETFSEILPKIVGIGYTIIEDLILETLYSKYGIKLEQKEGNMFPDYVRALKDEQIVREKI